MSLLSFLGAYALLTILFKWWERHDYRLPRFRRRTAASRPYDLAADLDRLMPGKSLTIGLHGREFTIVEREEFELIAKKAGFDLKITV